MNWKKIFVSSFILALLSALAPSSCPAMPKVERIVLDNRLTLLVFEDHSIPAVTLQSLIGAGSLRDPAGLAGAANLTVRSAPAGTRDLSFNEINNRLDFLGATLETECSKDFARIGMQVLKKHLDDGFGLFMQILTAASFPERDVEREKDNVIGKIRSDQDKPMEVANRAFEKALFLKSPYATAVEGSEESLAGITPAALARFYGDFYRPNNTILVVGGDITTAEVKTRLVPALLKWAPADIPNTPFAADFAEDAVSVKIEKPVSQASIVMGGRGIERGHKDYYAFSVLNQILGSGDLGSRLMSEIRVKAGLAYSVQSLLLARKYAGSFRILIQTKISSAQEAISLAVAEVERMQREPVSEDELEQAKKFLIGNFPLRFASTQQDYAKFLAQVEFFGLGLDYPEKYPSLIREVTARDILRVANEYLSPSAHVLVIVADNEKSQQ